MKKIKIDVSALDARDSTFAQGLLNRFDKLIATTNWTSGRDVNYLAKSVFARFMQDTPDHRYALLGLKHNF